MRRSLLVSRPSRASPSKSRASTSSASGRNRPTATASAHPIKVTVKRRGVDVAARRTFTYGGGAVAADKSGADAVNRALRATTLETECRSRLRPTA